MKQKVALPCAMFNHSENSKLVAFKEMIGKQVPTYIYDVELLNAHTNTQGELGVKISLPEQPSCFMGCYFKEIYDYLEVQDSTIAILKSILVSDVSRGHYCYTTSLKFQYKYVDYYNQSIETIKEVVQTYQGIGTVIGKPQVTISPLTKEEKEQIEAMFDLCKVKLARFVYP